MTLYNRDKYGIMCSDEEESHSFRPMEGADKRFWMCAGSDEKNAYQMILKQIPDNEFMAFYEDNPGMRYAFEDYSVPAEDKAEGG